tara:strand:- start:256 stop:564 length:309 start_codon:yes stop_codon:yes gene_type:complete
MNNDNLNILRRIYKNPKQSQRKMANQLGFSLGKLNYCIKQLREKGLIKINNFRKSDNKFKYMYILTPKGVDEKTKITINFMKQKMKEYEELKRELKKTKHKK